MKLKVGDRVIAHKKSSSPQYWDEFLKDCPGGIGYITQTSPGIYVNRETVESSNWTFHEEDLTLYKPTSFMKTISNAFKKFINADLQAQVKAGFRNSDLELTEEGKNVLLELIVDSVADKFTAAAQEKVAEEEKAK